jgi:hypothetical protein
MTRNNYTALRRGAAAAIFGAGLAVAGPAAIAFAIDDIDQYGSTGQDSFTTFNGTSETTYTTDFNSYIVVDETTGKITPEFSSTPQTPVTVDFPKGVTEYGYASQDTTVNYFGDSVNENVTSSEIAVGTQNVFEPLASQTIPLPNLPDPTPNDLFPF